MLKFQYGAPHPLEEDAGSELDLPHGSGAGDLAKVSRTQGALGVIQVHEVENVGNFGAGLKLDGFQEPEVAGQRGVDVAITRTGVPIAATAAIETGWTDASRATGGGQRVGAERSGVERVADQL